MSRQGVHGLWNFWNFGTSLEFWKMPGILKNHLEFFTLANISGKSLEFLKSTNLYCKGGSKLYKKEIIGYMAASYSNYPHF